ncbi:MAG: hypothetical protein IPF93_24580 [Saprospiraceae bacterium]|nr:hypothetical protein [Saprospiraceae bacterium]
MNLYSGYACLTILAYFVGFNISASYAQGPYNQIKGARSNALSNQSVALKGVDAAVSNAAALGQITLPSVSLFGESRIIGTGIHGSSFLCVLPIKNIGGLGFGGEFYGVPEYNQQVYKIGYGRKLSDQWSIGSSLEYISYHTSQRDPFSIGVVQVGTQYDFKKVGFAFSYFHPLTGEADQGQYQAPIWLAGMRYELSDLVRLYVEVEKEGDFDAYLKFATEYQLIPELALRAGVTNGPASFCFGVGTRVSKRLDIDISTIFYQHLGVSPSLGLRYFFKDNALPNQ